MTTKTVGPSTRKVREKPERPVPELPEVAVAAIASYKKQKEVTDFIHFILGALERNCNWLNTIVGRQNSFKCALMVGSGPNRFQIQEIIYPAGENDINLEIEMKNSEDHDKIAIAALIRLNNMELDNLSKYMKTRLVENNLLREDLLKGKALGVTFGVLRPISDKHYRVMERIAIGPLKCIEPNKKKRKDEKLFNGPLKKTKKIAHYIHD